VRRIEVVIGDTQYQAQNGYETSGERQKKHRENGGSKERADAPHDCSQMKRRVTVVISLWAPSKLFVIPFDPRLNWFINVLP
jgi:hypothetical protein